METLTINCMGTEFYVALSHSQSFHWKRSVTRFLKKWEREWSRFERNNELAKLNRCSVGERLQLSPFFYRLLLEAHTYYVKTNRHFSPYVKRHMERLGYLHSFSHAQWRPTRNNASEELEMFPPYIFEGNDTVWKQSEQEVDLGGCAKGYIVDRLVEWFQSLGTTTYGIVDGGGDMRFWSNGDKCWTIAVADPYDVTRPIHTFRGYNGAVATSNRLYRSWKIGNEQYHHILDGQTGRPVITNVIQATVRTKCAFEAEVLAKMCFLLEEEERKRWFMRHAPSSESFIVYEKESVSYD